ncbi:MAG: ATP-binding cassette domain-containing protein [Eubacterium sp.]|nr:ATP-binding cassette domain-containing protein [Eubacterium sp.]
METVLQARNLTQIFRTGKKKEVTAVDHVSFSILPGECLGIIGESGSGKSTVARMITGLISPTEGSVQLHGQNIAQMKKKNMRQLCRSVQMVFQSPQESFDPRCTLGDGIGESLRNQGMSRRETKKRVAALMEHCGLSAELADRYPDQVSGGQCQRAAIARALAIEPELLIMDEATSSLDVTVQKEILTLISRIRAERKDRLSVLFICHDIALVQSFCDRVLVMYRGQIVEEGTPDAIIQKPQNAYTRELIDSVLSL